MIAAGPTFLCQIWDLGEIVIRDGIVAVRIGVGGRIADDVDSEMKSRWRLW